MKKKLLFILSIVFLGLSFASCGDEEDKAENGSYIELFINGDKQTIKGDNIISPITYDSGGTYGEPSLFFYIYCDDKDNEDGGFFPDFTGISLDEIKVGDDLITKCSDFYYLLGYKDDSYILDKKSSSKSEFEGYQGKAIVKEYDKSNKIIKVEFSDITMPIQKGIYPSNEKTATVKCVIRYQID